MLPFDEAKLRSLMEAQNVDLVLASTRHNVRYLTGGYYFHFYAQSTRLGMSQYLSFVGVPRSRFEDAFYSGLPDEKGQIEAQGLWINERPTTKRGTVAAAEGAAAAVKKLGLDSKTIAVELPFIPGDALLTLQKELPGATFVDATPILDSLRAVKTAAELEVLRRVYDRTSASIQAGFHTGYPGITTLELAANVAKEMGQRGLNFLWCFTNAGPGYLRAPSKTTWDQGRALHLDAGGDENDYLADICRMGHLGQPTALADELYRAIIEIQDKVRGIVKSGLPASELLRAGEELVREQNVAAQGRFVAHGVGMVSHEWPIVSHENPHPLEAGNVLSIETEFHHPEVGHVKIEDAVAVTANGHEGLGDRGREWQIVGA